MSDEPKSPEPDSPAGKGGTGPVRGRARTAFGPGGWARRFAKLWGFLGFCILVLVLVRHVVLPFVFALLVAYILSPVVRWMSTTRDGARRMPRGLAIILCYVVILGLMTLFVVGMMPRISKDVARIGREAPALYKTLNDVWAPQAARWLEKRFPSLAGHPPPEKVAPVVADVPLPPGTAFVVTPLPDGRMALQVEQQGVEMTPLPDGGFQLAPSEREAEEVSLEEKLRTFASKRLAGLQNELGNLFKAGQAFIAGVVRSVFQMFLVLMIAAFIMLDIEKIHSFVRGLVPQGYREDYDVIVVGMDSGLAGVIRGQLLICVVNGVLTYIGLLIFGVKYSFILAVLAAILSLIPIFGTILSTVPIMLAALVSGEEGIDIMRAVFILGWILGIHFLEGNILNPKIIGTAAKIHPVLVIFALVVGQSSYGLTGALLAVPIMSMVQVLFVYFRSKAWRSDQTGQHTIRGQAST